MSKPIICKECNPNKIGNGYCAEHSTSGKAYMIKPKTTGGNKKSNNRISTKTISPQESIRIVSRDGKKYKIREITNIPDIGGRGILLERLS